MSHDIRDTIVRRAAQELRSLNEATDYYVNLASACRP